MKKLIIEGGRELKGTINISGAKNSIVALIPACCLTSGKCIIDNVPDISDVRNLIEIMEFLGSKIEFFNDRLTIDNSNLKNKTIPASLSSKLRASYYFMGALLGKYKHCAISEPGGCVIGSRPIDFHLNSFRKMGADIVEKNDYLYLDAKKISSTNIFLDMPSVGATINVMIAAVLSEGTTTIVNAASEPEITNIASFLNSMGAKIFGAGSSKITIVGVKELHDGYVEVIPDRIEAGTYLIIGSLIGRNLKINGIITEHLDSLIMKLDEAGVPMKIEDNSITVSKTKNLKPVNIKTAVYPGFPTDLGQPMSTFLTQCNGKCLFEETIYENRLRHVPHLNNMGADIKAFDKSAIIMGPTKLHGRKVKATDLRAGASMLVAGIIADGTTTIYNIEHLLRGYERIVDKLNNVGAKIEMVDE